MALSCDAYECNTSSNLALNFPYPINNRANRLCGGFVHSVFVFILGFRYVSISSDPFVYVRMHNAWVCPCALTADDRSVCGENGDLWHFQQLRGSGSVNVIGTLCVCVRQNDGLQSICRSPSLISYSLCSFTSVLNGQRHAHTLKLWPWSTKNKPKLQQN